MPLSQISPSPVLTFALNLTTMQTGHTSLNSSWRQCVSGVFTLGIQDDEFFRQTDILLSPRVQKLRAQHFSLLRVVFPWLFPVEGQTLSVRQVRVDRVQMIL